MPTLAATPNTYPENLLDDWTIGPTDRRWWAIYTKARQEKALARQLLAYEVPFYLPLVAKDNLIRGRRVRSHLPLFAGYVFLYGDESERVRSLTTNRISRILPVDSQHQLWYDLRQIWRLIASDEPITVEQRLCAGQRVRIRAGAMKDLEGTVISRRRKARLLVAVTFLQQGVSVELDDFLLEPLH